MQKRSPCAVLSSYWNKASFTPTVRSSYCGRSQALLTSDGQIILFLTFRSLLHFSRNPPPPKKKTSLFDLFMNFYFLPFKNPLATKHVLRGFLCVPVLDRFLDCPVGQWACSPSTLSSCHASGEWENHRQVSLPMHGSRPSRVLPCFRKCLGLLLRCFALGSSSSVVFICKMHSFQEFPFHLAGNTVEPMHQH